MKSYGSIFRRRRDAMDCDDDESQLRRKPTYQVPIAIKISNPDTTIGYPSDRGIFYHTPRDFNYDIYAKKDGLGSLYFCKIGNYSGWRTTIGTLEKGGFADPANPQFGFGDQEPCGTNVQWDGKGSHYLAPGIIEWTVKFIWTQEELEKEEPCTPESSFMDAAAAAGLTITEKVAKEWIEVLDGESEAFMVELYKDGIPIDNLKRLRDDFYKNFKDGDKFEDALKKYQQEYKTSKTTKAKISISSFIDELLNEECPRYLKGYRLPLQGYRLPDVPGVVLDQDNIDDLICDLGFDDEAVMMKVKAVRMKGKAAPKAQRAKAAAEPKKDDASGRAAAEPKKDDASKAANEDASCLSPQHSPRCLLPLSPPPRPKNLTSQI
jgi:hypothetical protein